jgi:carboxypeptidase C (cathepsin A)
LLRPRLILCCNDNDTIADNWPQHLKIVGAGHMVPYDKPVEALTMLTQWLGGVDFA